MYTAVANAPATGGVLGGGTRGRGEAGRQGKGGIGWGCVRHTCVDIAIENEDSHRRNQSALVQGKQRVLVLMILHVIQHIFSSSMGHGAPALAGPLGGHVACAHMFMAWPAGHCAQATCPPHGWDGWKPNRVNGHTFSTREISLVGNRQLRPKAMSIVGCLSHSV